MNSNQEIWKTIDTFNIYEVSNFGRIRNNKTFKIIKQRETDRGYLVVTLHPHKTLRVARLVAFAFCHKESDNLEVDHIDRDKSNNNCDNLRWVSHSINCYNKNIQSNNKSGYKGVSFDKENNKWISSWVVNGKRNKKRFDELNDAVLHRQSVEAVFD